jgi:exodeoxyribonuclease-3
VATFFKQQPDAVVMGMGDEQFDVEGRVIQTVWGGIRLFNIYFPNGQRGQDRVDYKLAFYAHLLSLCDELHKQGEQIIITGDFNTAHMPIDLKNPKENEKTSGFLPEEREWVQNFLDHGFVDAYRHLYPDKVEYTWWTYRLNARQRGIGWRLDYFLVSESLMPRVKDVIVYGKVMGSDHCPVELALE